MGRYQTLFAALQETGKKAFIPFTVLGYPHQDASFELIQTLVDNGASALELGFAFSDPMADGTIIQRADHDLLAAGYTVEEALQLLKRVRDYAPDIPIGLLVYYNMMLARGIDAFCRDVQAAGADGILVADLPPELMQEVTPACQAHQLDLISMVSPLTSDDRLQAVLQHAGGFLYVVSRLGITGVEERYDEQLAALLSRLHAQTSLPCCVGFGISRPEHAEKMIELGADGVIVGSRIVQLIQDTPFSECHQALAAYMQSMAAVCA